MECNENQKYVANQTLCLMYMDIKNETNLETIQIAWSTLKKTPLKEAIEKLNNLINKDDEKIGSTLSIFPKGIVKTFWSPEKTEYDQFIKKTQEEEDYKLLCMTDQWTIKEFVDMMSVVMLFLSAEYLNSFYDDMKKYVNAEIQFIPERILWN